MSKLKPDERGLALWNYKLNLENVELRRSCLELWNKWEQGFRSHFHCKNGGTYGQRRREHIKQLEVVIEGCFSFEKNDNDIFSTGPL